MDTILSILIPVAAFEATMAGLFILLAKALLAEERTMQEGEPHHT